MGDIPKEHQRKLVPKRPGDGMPKNTVYHWICSESLFDEDWFSTMADQTKIPSTPRGAKGSHSDAATIPAPGPRRDGHRSRHVDITAMIRSLQRTEGFADCFRSGLADCDQLECAWRQYCLDTAKNAWAESDD